MWRRVFEPDDLVVDGLFGDHVDVHAILARLQLVHLGEESTGSPAGSSLAGSTTLGSSYRGLRREARTA